MDFQPTVCNPTPNCSVLVVSLLRCSDFYVQNFSAQRPSRSLKERLRVASIGSMRLWNKTRPIWRGV